MIDIQEITVSADIQEINATATIQEIDAKGLIDPIVTVEVIPFKEHRVFINVSTAQILNSTDSNYYPLTWSTTPPFQSWTTTIIGTSNNVEVYLNKPLDNSEGDRVRINKTTVSGNTVITISGISSGPGDPGQVNNVDFTIRIKTS